MQTTTTGAACFHIWERNPTRNREGVRLDIKVIIDADLECMQGGKFVKIERVPLSALPDVVKQESMKMIRAESK